MSTHPRLRTIEAFGIEHEGHPHVMIRDPEGLCPRLLAVPLPLFMIMIMFDGNTSTSDIRDALARQAGGQIVITSDQLEAILVELDEFYLLENDRAAQRRLELEAEYEGMETRPASHAGQAYPDDPAQCADFMNGLFDGQPGPDAPLPRALIVPHIDLRVGGRTIAGGIARLNPAQPADLYIILGVAHQPGRNLFIVTDKTFETPLGPVEVDRAAVARLEELYGRERLSGAAIHRAEHSIEFQALALRHHHRQSETVRILPILCGGMVEELLTDGPPPREREEIGQFIESLRRLMTEYEGRVCLIASVDLSHVGLKFGDAEGVDEARAEVVRREDLELLEQVRAIDPEGFFSHLRRDGNQRHVDAGSAVYVLLHVLGEATAGDVDYQQWYEEETNSMVTYATVPFY